MRLKVRVVCILLFLAIFTGDFGYSQQGRIIIVRDRKIDSLLYFRKLINKQGGGSIENRYKIQIYFGSKSGADSAYARFKAEYPSIYCEITFETPNYKVRVGNFTNRITADKYLLRIRKKFPNAFLYLM